MKTRLFALSALAACAGFAWPAAADDGAGAYHLYQPSLHLKAVQGASSVLYHGGPVMGAAKIAVVIWGNGVSRLTRTRIGPFASAIVNSTYVDRLASYGTSVKAVGGRQGTGQAISRGAYLGQFLISPGNASRTLSDSDIQAELENQVASGALPPRDPDTLYMIYLPASVAVTAGNAKSCDAFSAYHAAAAKVSGSNIFYAVVPDCGGGFNAVTSASSRVFAAAVTDAIPVTGTAPKYPQAWMTSDGHEMAELCDGDHATLTAAGKTYVVGDLFDNIKNACIAGAFTSP
jgi:hypothetical protein